MADQRSAHQILHHFVIKEYSTFTLKGFRIYAILFTEFAIQYNPY